MSATADKVMQCLEVWGGNRQAEQSVVMPGLDAWVFSRPCGSAVEGGDVHYISTCAAGRYVRMLLADVSGHGEGVGRVAGDLRNLMRQHVNDHDHTRFVRSINEEFAGSTAANIFATAVALSFDAPEDALHVCNAGHPPPLLFRAADQQWTTLEPGASANVPLGILEGVIFSETSAKLAVGDMVLCYTDGFIEARKPTGGMLEIAGLLEATQTLSRENPDPATLLHRLAAHVCNLSQENIDLDDLTCLLIRAHGSRPEMPISDWLASPFVVLADKLGVPFTRHWSSR